MPPPKNDDAHGSLVALIRARASGAGRALVVALDGFSGAGKSTLAAAVAAQISAAVVDIDDFYAGGTPDFWRGLKVSDRSNQCIDWRRLRHDALDPLRSGKPAIWRPYDWDTDDGSALEEVRQLPASVILVDGTYSSHPDLQDVIDATVFLDVPAELRQRRVQLRDGGLDELWHLFDAAEQHYFSEVRPQSSFDLVIRPAT